VRRALEDRLQSFARGSLRVLALAMRPMPAKQSAVTPADERDLTFLGFVGMMDPPRSEVGWCRLTL
jgi:magnesium-transporting ATPase (P-type)